MTERSSPRNTKNWPAGEDDKMGSDFQFVSVIPTADGRAMSKQKSLVRKNAAKYVWRHNKSTSTKNEARKHHSPSPSSGCSAVLVEHAEEVPNETRKLAKYGLHESQAALQTYLLSFAGDDKIIKIIKFSESGSCSCFPGIALTIRVQKMMRR